jgi:hypothetical protein
MWRPSLLIPELEPLFSGLGEPLPFFPHRVATLKKERLSPLKQATADVVAFLFLGEEDGKEHNALMIPPKSFVWTFLALSLLE